MAGRKSWIETNLPHIEKELEELPQRVLKLKDVSQLLNAHRRRWKLPGGLTRDTFVKALLEANILTKTVVFCPNYNDEKLLYLLGDPSPLAVGLALRPDSYLSHSSAMYIHSLTHQRNRSGG